VVAGVLHTKITIYMLDTRKYENRIKRNHLNWRRALGFRSLKE
jgi:hypothetical protein